MLTETEKYLIFGIQSGDYKAFRILFDSYYSSLCRLATTYVRSRETAKDIVSDFFVKIWEQPHVLSAEISLKGYLYRSIYNSCMNYVSRHTIKFGNLDDITNERLYELMPKAAAELPSEDIMLAELSGEIEKAISDLPSECGKIFIMSRKDGLSYHEIADKLKLSENTVKVQIYRALVRLRDALKEYL